MLLALTSFPLPALELPDLLRRAHELRLAEDPAWLVLLHYGSTLRGRHSLVDDPRFFLAPGGKHDPSAELDATLAGLLAGDPAQPEAAVAARFPARTRFLAEHLGFTPADLPVPGSPELDKLLAEVAAERALLVFPTGYLASPASMFGHTLLLVQGKGQESRLLAQAINYGANTGTGGGPLAVIKGLFGFFPGYFNVLPYHRKVQEYTDLDQRDIWEYPLALTPDEIDRLLRHCWELKGIGSDYWFFDENCSFNLLFLLEVARPGTRLTARAGWWVIPVDTVRWVREAGLIDQAQYRPSRATLVGAARRALPPADSALAVDIARGTAVPAAAADLPPDRRAAVYDLAGEALHALAGRQAISIAEYRTRLHATLTARAALGAQPPLPAPPTPLAPDLGHGSGRVAVGVGHQDHSDYLSLGWRAAQHDLLDAADGYLPGAALTFGELDLRWHRGERPVINRLDAVRVTSLAPWDGVFNRLSWTAGGGLLAERMADGGLHHQAALQGGGGLATTVPGGLAWAMAIADARGFGVGPGYALAPGAQAGAALGAGPLRLLATAQWQRVVLPHAETWWELAGGVRVATTGWLALDAGVSRYRRWDRVADGIQLRAMLYY